MNKNAAKTVTHTSKAERRDTGLCPLRPYFYIVGEPYVVSKYVLGKLPTFTISFLRFVIAFITLTLMGRKRRAAIARRDVPWLLVLGVCGYFAAVGAQLLGTKYAGASMASLLNALNPVTITLFGAVILHERLTMRKAAGLILALIGVYTILGGGTAGSRLGIICVLFCYGHFFSGTNI